MPSDKLGSKLEDPSISREDHLEIDEQDLQKGKDEAIEVSYSMITTDQLPKQILDDVLQKISTMVNVQLAEEGSEKLPFIPFLDFEKARAFDKLFLYGPSGCGKSRAMFELIKENLSKLKKIYFINPRNTIGAESGRIKLLDLLGRLEEDDGVVWDNFPDDLVKRDLDTAKHVLDLVSSRNVNRLFITLKPRYLEIYKDLPREIPDFSSCEVSFDKDRLRKIILAYGTTITEFKDPYEKYIAEHADKISRILWQKEPTPLTILGYYKLLKERIKEQQKISPDLTIDSIIEAERLPRSTDYYEQQFEFMRRTQERRNDTEFLHTLKLCYECGLDRTVSSVEKLQLEIFGSVTSQDMLPRLSTWIYVSGQYYAMHDVQRESIKFSDHVKLKMMDYLIHNFLKVVPNEDSQLNSFGLFLGRNIQYVHKDNLNQFLGQEIQEYMKKKRYFYTALGQGVGESFLSLDEELQEEMMKRMAIDVEFTRGAVLGIGERFPILDRMRQREILEEKSKSFACVPLFAEAIAINFKSMTGDLQEELFEHAEKNPQVADGLARGLGSNFSFINDDLKKQIFDKANKNHEFSRGLGYPFASGLASSDETCQKEIFKMADNNSQFAKGLGMGCAYFFEKLSEQTKRQVLARSDYDSDFAWGLGIYLGLNFHPQSEELQRDIMKRVEENSRFAFGLGTGYGMTFPYYPKEFQNKIFDRGNRNSQFDAGLGFGVGYSFGSLTKEHKDMIFSKIMKNAGLAEGVGFGFGFTATLLPQEIWSDIFRISEDNLKFARGLGHGLGYMFRYLPIQFRSDVIERSKKNVHMTIGLGSGLGYVFPYLPDEIQSEAWERAENDANFANGLGIGIGTIFRYLNSDFQTDLWKRAEKNIQFSLGLGEGLGYIFKYLSGELREYTLMRIQQNNQFAEGFGIGIGQRFAYLSKEFQKEILSRAQTNIHLAYGLAYGLGMIYQYLANDLKDEVSRINATNVYFADGWGRGIGISFPYLNRDLQEDILERMLMPDHGFAYGLGSGLGTIFSFLTKETQDKLLRRVDELNYFANGLGKGLANTFPFLGSDFQKNVMGRLEANKPLANGVGTSFGFNFSYLDEKFQNDILNKILTNPEFAKGLGKGLGSSIRSRSKNLEDKIFEKAKVSTQFAFGFGYGLANYFTSADREYERYILNRVREEDVQLVWALGFALSHTFVYLPKENQEFILHEINGEKKNNHVFARALGEGLGHSFPLFGSELQETVLKLAENRNSYFANGLGFGLGYNFGNLDEIVQDELLLQGEEESEFTKSWGHGIGYNFPSLTNKLQAKILKNLLGGSSMYTEGFALGLSHSFKYLGEDTREQITNLSETNSSISLQKYLQMTTTRPPSEPSRIDKAAITIPALAYNETIEEYDHFPLPSSFMEHTELLGPWNVAANVEEEISFSGLRQDYCICYIDMMDSTRIASELKDNELGKYYALFLNATATIARNFGAKIIKNAGDCLIYYFPKTSDARNNPASLKDVLECGITMTMAHRVINARLHEEKLPPLSYRISADFGRVEVAKSKSSQSDDLFGSAMNLCAKINSKAPANGMVIGQALYDLIKSFDNYKFSEVEENQINAKYQYPAYLIESKQKRTILNPFRKVSQS
ncbi:MAG: hypothetical protein M3136_00460 [Thermoproteota archaeon]|nr:hypothetical protein [Thermoproteota archaeon]